MSVVALTVYMGIIFFLSSLPGDFLNPEREFGFYIDQAIKHFAEFSILGILMANVFWQLTSEITFHKVFVTFFVSSVFSALYGVSDEIHQYFVPTRYCTVFDVLTNIVGSMTGVFVFLMYIRIKSLRNHETIE